jgi:hypothetical protein
MGLGAGQISVLGLALREDDASYSVVQTDETGFTDRNARAASGAVVDLHPDAFSSHEDDGFIEANIQAIGGTGAARFG